MADLLPNLLPSPLSPQQLERWRSLQEDKRNQPGSQESGVVLKDGVLTVVGTEEDDDIEVLYDDEKEEYVARLNGKESRFKASEVERVDVDGAGGGDDIFAGEIDDPFAAGFRAQSTTELVKAFAEKAREPLMKSGFEAELSISTGASGTSGDRVVNRVDGAEIDASAATRASYLQNRSSETQVRGSNFGTLLDSSGDKNVLAGGASDDLLRSAGNANVLVGGRGADMALLDYLSEGNTLVGDVLDPKSGYVFDDGTTDELFAPSGGATPNSLWSTAEVGYELPEDQVAEAFFDFATPEVDRSLEAAVAQLMARDPAFNVRENGTGDLFNRMLAAGMTPVDAMAFALALAKHYGKQETSELGTYVMDQAAVLKAVLEGVLALMASGALLPGPNADAVLSK